MAFRLRHCVSFISCVSPTARLAALLPCFWVYMHVGHKMLEAREALVAAAGGGEAAPSGPPLRHEAD